MGSKSQKLAALLQILWLPVRLLIQKDPLLYVQTTKISKIPMTTTAWFLTAEQTGENAKAVHTTKHEWGYPVDKNTFYPAEIA